MKKIIMTDEDITYIEKTFYEYNISKDIISYITNQNINNEYFEKYLKKTISLGIEVELIKKELFKKYCPDIYKEKTVKYNFNFIDKTLELFFENDDETIEI